MITIEESPQHVLAARVTGTLDQADIEILQDAFRPKLDAGEPFGIVVELSEWSDITADAIAADAKLEFGLLTKIDRFPRISFVSDKHFVRALARFADPLTPTTKIRTFGSKDYEAALAFASELPRSQNHEKQSITLIETGDSRIIGFEINGVVTKADLTRVIAPLKRAFETEGKINVFGRFTNYAGFSPAIFAAPDFLSMKMTAVTHIRRYAVVGAPGWMATAARLFTAMLPIEARFFDDADDAEAMAWLNE